MGCSDSLYCYIVNGKMKRAFTFIELLIVVAVIGILAAVVLPGLQDYSQNAKESAAKRNLQILRNAIERYAAQHNGIAPGYINNETSSTPNGMIFIKQLAMATNILGQAIDGNLGPYIVNIPENPFNGGKLVIVIDNSQPFPSEPPGGTQGWVYKPATKEIRLNYAGTDTQGQQYYSY